MPTTQLTGHEINGYIVGPLIGEGGMGDVYQARSLKSGAVVAIKVLAAELTQNESYSQRFIREIRLMESLQHENIVPIYDYGVYDGQLYFTMKLISGSTLEIERHKVRYTPKSAWKLVRPLAQALDYVHQSGIIHRDLKPQNIFLQRISREDDWHPYIGDFGLGKRPGFDESLTMSGSSIGTLEYMSTEAIIGREALDERTDVYSLAAIVYEMLVGALPVKYSSKRPPNFTDLTKPAPLPRDRHPNFPESLEVVLMRGVERDREMRYQTVRAFAEEYYAAISNMTSETRNTSYAIDQDEID